MFIVNPIIREIFFNLESVCFPEINYKICIGVFIKIYSKVEQRIVSRYISGSLVHKLMTVVRYCVEPKLLMLQSINMSMGSSHQSQHNEYGLDSIKVAICKIY